MSADGTDIRQSKAELMRILAENAALPSPFVAIADAITDAPRSPILNDMALSKAATSFVAAQAASSALLAEIHRIAADTMTRAAARFDGPITQPRMTRWTFLLTRSASSGAG